ncbi:MAG: hypothetical protein ABSD31_16665 [Candidatus Binataceae bacterium]|jgi:hypothetical protein
MNRWQAVTSALVAILSLGLGLNYVASAQTDKPAAASAQAKVEAVGYATAVVVHGKIVAVNKAKKLVTLEGPEGRKVTLKVENPYNLKAAKVGEPVVAHYYEIVTIRKKKPGESIPSASLTQGIATAKPGAIPGAVVGQKLELVVTVTAIDEAHGTVTVKGPDGATETVKARDPKNLKLIKVGDDLVVSVSRAVAISLEKESSN